MYINPQILIYLSPLSPLVTISSFSVSVDLFLFSHALKNFFRLFLAALGLRCCTYAFSGCAERGLCFVVGHRLLIAVASLVAENGP